MSSVKSILLPSTGYKMPHHDQKYFWLLGIFTVLGAVDPITCNERRCDRVSISIVNVLSYSPYKASTDP